MRSAEVAKLGPTFVKKLLNSLAISSFFEIILLFFIKYSGHVGLFLRLLITSFSIFQVSLTFAFFLTSSYNSFF